MTCTLNNIGSLKRALEYYYNAAPGEPCCYSYQYYYDYYLKIIPYNVLKYVSIFIYL